MLMGSCHIAHDVWLGDNNIIGNSSVVLRIPSPATALSAIFEAVGQHEPPEVRNVTPLGCSLQAM